MLGPNLVAVEVDVAVALRRQHAAGPILQASVLLQLFQQETMTGARRGCVDRPAFEQVMAHHCRPDSHSSHCQSKNAVCSRSGSVD